MPVHDWSRVDAGTFHDFHSAWITHLKETLNEGHLPDGFYALSEQHAGMRIPDIVTLHSPDILTGRPRPAGDGGVALIEAPPRLSRKLVASPELSYKGLRRTLAIRHASGHRLVAIIEIVSPGNKDRLSSVEEIADKVESALRNRVHVLLVDLFPPGKHDPRGIHGAAWSFFDTEAYAVPSDRPLTLASYLAGQIPEAYVEHVRFGEPLPEMPLFIEYRAHINVPLEPTYSAAFRGMPAIFRSLLEAEAR
jgi:Protein of unknown function (DUF4058)